MTRLRLSIGSLFFLFHPTIMVLLSDQQLNAQPAPVLVPAAISYLDSQVRASQQAFYVFAGGDSALNHGFPSGAYGSTGHDSGPVLNTSCVFVANPRPACDTNGTADPAGTVLSLAFPALRTNDEYTGMYFQEPEQITSTIIAGYDLTGSREVIFDAASSGGGTGVIFSVGSDGESFTYQIPATWTEFQVPISASRLNINNLLSIAEAGPTAANNIFIRNIRFNPLPSSRSPVLGLPLSFSTLGVQHSATIGNGLVPVPIDQVLTNLATTADSSLALLALLRSDSGVASARAIGDALVVALHNDNHGLLIPLSPGRVRGLRNGYMGGDLTLHDDQAPRDPALPLVYGRAGDVRLPGFSVGPAEIGCGPSHFCLVLNGANGASNALAAIALVAASARFDTPGPDASKTYLSAAREIGNWIWGVLYDSSGYGGFVDGYPDLGQLPTSLSLGKSTAANAMIFSAFRALATAVQDSDESKVWFNRSELAAQFVERMYDDPTGSFFSGTARLGQGVIAQPGVIPDGPVVGNDIVNIYDFADAQLVPLLALANVQRPNSKMTPARWQSALQWLQPMQRVLPSATGPTVQGLSLTARALPGSPDGIAWQYTGEAVIALRIGDALLPNSSFVGSANSFMAGIEWAQSNSLGAPVGSVPAATLDRSVASAEACIAVPFQCIPARGSVASTAWAIFAATNVNPFGGQQ